jgi:microcompartment protein CcmK/EutM
MFLARIKGNIVSTHKNKFLVGHKLLIVHPIDYNGNLIGKKEFVALDQTDAGVGDIVIVVQEGDAVEQILGNSDLPVNTMVIGIADDIEIEE